jgi:endonuclease-8
VPEGDTIFRAARTLHKALAGKPVVRFESVLPALMRVHEDQPLTAQSIDKVEAAGKHLLMHFSAGLVLRTHMRMNGSWHIYRPGERWRRARRDMRILIATADFEAVGFNIPVAEFVRVSELPKHRELARLGPDVLSDGFDEDEAVRRLRARPAWQIGAALLNQRIVAGLGNVYKSEVLFLGRVNPFTPVERLNDETLRNVIAIGRKLLALNVTADVAPMTTYTSYRRTTGRHNPSERLWVYGRARLPCRRCATAVAVKKQGLDARLTYWCPSCQAAESPD